MAKIDYNFKFNKIKPPLFDSLPQNNQKLIVDLAHSYLLSASELKRFVDSLLDLSSWGLFNESLLPPLLAPKSERNIREENLKIFYEKIEKLKSDRFYDESVAVKSRRESKKSVVKSSVDAKILGRCPVASPLTLCCNLITVDSFKGCAFDCSYCSIGVFRESDKVVIDTNFKEKLAEVKLDPNEIYHFGTGQSSDSLLLGNREGHLDSLIELARSNSNLILELKSKSKEVAPLLKMDLPKNIISTWSLNPQVVIDHEEHLTATLADRIASAKKIAKQGNLVGFHFHPIFYYQNYQIDYQKIIAELVFQFDPQSVACISFGALTYTTKVMQGIRENGRRTKILQMPLEEIAGKYSYPLKLKSEIFKMMYDAFSPWHGKVFFYLCMEDRSLWKPIFGYEYATNEDFEKAMKESYMNKIISRSSK